MPRTNWPTQHKLNAYTYNRTWVEETSFYSGQQSLETFILACWPVVQLSIYESRLGKHWGKWARKDAKARRQEGVLWNAVLWTWQCYHMDELTAARVTWTRPALESRQLKSLQKWERWSPGCLQRSYFQGRMWPLAVLLSQCMAPHPCTYEQNWLDFVRSNVFLKDKVGRSVHCRDTGKGGGRIILITHA